MKIGEFIRALATGGGLSRRELLKRAGIVSATATLPLPAFPSTKATAPAEGAFETLTGTELEVLEAIVARLIPTDDNGPGAAEAGAAHYINCALSGALARHREMYSTGLAAVDAYAKASWGGAFTRLSGNDQDGVLSVMERSEASGFEPNSATFFELLRAHTIEGTFCDPYYGGNVDLVGWDLLGYPGVRVVVTAPQQQIDAAVLPSGKSAYDYRGFSTPGTHRGS